MTSGNTIAAMTKTTRLELNGINIIEEHQRSGSPRSLFWPWAAGNVSLLALSYGSFFLGFGISFWQATWAAIIGVIASFVLVGVSSLAGKRSNAPTMTLSRAAFGVKGNVIPGVLSYLVFVGWETVLVSLATLATETIFTRLGHIDHNLARIIGFLIAAGLTIFGGVLGFHIIMKIQRWLTIATIVLTVGYMALTINKIQWSHVHSIHSGSLQAFIGALIFGVTGIGLGWVNSAADYSRYLPRHSSSKGVVGWTVFGSSIVPILMVVFGALLAGSSKSLSGGIANDPVGALTTILPTWYLIPFAIVAVLGLIGGAILDLYSSGITLVSIGLPAKRYQAASLDGLIMTLGTIYFVWIAKNFFVPLQGFLVTLGVPVAVWSAIFVADVIMRKRDYNESDLFDSTGRYGSWNLTSVAIMVVGTVVGFGFVTNQMAWWLTWQGYFLGAIGGKSGAWAYSNIGILFALVIGFVGHLTFGRNRIKSQEAK
jgi:purine-cytosine permease-like protein